MIDSPEAIQMRLLACHYCRRIWARYPSDWADKVFTEDDGNPGGYVHAANWRNRIPRDAIEVAENYCNGLATTDALVDAHNDVVVFAEEMSDNWLFAAHKLGDSATGAEYEVGAVTFYTAAACAAASAFPVNLTDCRKNASEAIGFAWDCAESIAKISEEGAIQEQIMRTWPATDTGR